MLFHRIGGTYILYSAGCRYSADNTGTAAATGTTTGTTPHVTTTTTTILLLVVSIYYCAKQYSTGTIHT